MTLYQLIKTNDWLSVELTFRKLFPDQNKALDLYKEIYHKLKMSLPAPSDISIVLEITDESGSSYVDVSGRTQKPTQNITDSLALELVPWCEWLGMKIDARTTKSFTEFEIICHCLNEMTFFGFDDAEIQQQLKKLKRIETEYREMSDEEKRRNTKSIDDIPGRNRERKNGK